MKNQGIGKPFLGDISRKRTPSSRDISLNFRTAKNYMHCGPRMRKIVICGAGVIGASIAYHLTLRGEKPLIVERCAIACGASGKAGGFLALDWCDTLPLRALVRKSFEMHSRLSESLSADYRRLDTLQVDISEKDVGKPPRAEVPPWIDGCASSARPLGNTATTAQVHPEKFTIALVDEAIKRGAQIKYGTVEGVQIENAQIRGVKVDGELIEADIVIIAMGPWSIQATKWFQLPKIQGLKAHSIVVQPTQPITPHALFLEYSTETSSFDPEVYPRPDGQVYLCGFSEYVPLPEDPQKVEPRLETREKLLRVASTLSTSLAQADLLRFQACFLPISPDNVPLIGKIPNVEGAFIATAHGCWGILNAPGTGLALAELICDGKATSLDLTPFDPARFLRETR